MFYQYAIILTLYCAFVKQKFLPKENRAHIENMVKIPQNYCLFKRNICALNYVLNIENVNSVLILKLWNTSCKVPYVKKDRFITDKDDSNVHGWGVESVKSIVNKYNGSIEFKYDETFFEVVIIMEEA